MSRKPMDLTLSDLPGADATRFGEWRRLHRRARVAPLLGMIAWATAFITVPVIGGGIGWALPILLWFAYTFAYAVPLAARERKLAVELGVPAALGLPADHLARADRRVQVAKTAGLALLGVATIAVVLLYVASRSDQSAAATGSTSQTPTESLLVQLNGYPGTFSAARVGPGFFDGAKVDPLAGRFFLPSDFGASAEPVVVLSHDLWQRLFAGDLGILGRSIELSGDEAAVIAIAPPGFTVPAGADIWIPVRGSR